MDILLSLFAEIQLQLTAIFFSLVFYGLAFAAVGLIVGIGLVIWGGRSGWFRRPSAIWSVVAGFNYAYIPIVLALFGGTIGMFYGAESSAHHFIDRSYPRLVQYSQQYAKQATALIPDIHWAQYEGMTLDGVLADEMAAQLGTSSDSYAYEFYRSINQAVMQHVLDAMNIPREVRDPISVVQQMQSAIDRPSTFVGLSSTFHGQVGTLFWGHYAWIFAIFLPFLMVPVLEFALFWFLGRSRTSVAAVPTRTPASARPAAMPLRDTTTPTVAQAVAPPVVPPPPVAPPVVFENPAPPVVPQPPVAPPVVFENPAPPVAPPPPVASPVVFENPAPPVVPPPPVAPPVVFENPAPPVVPPPPVAPPVVFENPAPPVVPPPLVASPVVFENPVPPVVPPPPVRSTVAQQAAAPTRPATSTPIVPISAESGTAVIYILGGSLLQLCGSVGEGWLFGFIAIFGFAIFYVGLNKLGSQLDAPGQSATNLLKIAAIIGAISSVVDFIPILGIVSILGYMAAFVMELIGYVQLKNSHRIGIQGKSGANLLLFSMVLILLVEVFDLIPYLGRYLAAPVAFVAILLIFFGWVRVHEGLFEQKK
jgi:hypothetical protein